MRHGFVTDEMPLLLPSEQLFSTGRNVGKPATAADLILETQILL